MTRIRRGALAVAAVLAVGPIPLSAVARPHASSPTPDWQALMELQANAAARPKPPPGTRVGGGLIQTGTHKLKLSIGCHHSGRVTAKVMGHGLGRHQFTCRSHYASTTFRHVPKRAVRAARHHQKVRFQDAITVRGQTTHQRGTLRKPPWRETEKYEKLFPRLRTGLEPTGTSKAFTYWNNATATCEGADTGSGVGVLVVGPAAHAMLLGAYYGDTVGWKVWIWAVPDSGTGRWEPLSEWRTFRPFSEGLNNDITTGDDGVGLYFNYGGQAMNSPPPVVSHINPGWTVYPYIESWSSTNGVANAGVLIDVADGVGVVDPNGCSYS